MPNLITTVMPANTADEIKTRLNEQITAIKPFKINLTDDAKTGARTMAEGREGLARLVSNIAIANIDSARENDPQQLKDRLDYDDRLEGVRQLALTIVETVTETQLANGIDIMNLVDAFAANLQTSRSGNGSLDEAMRGVDEYNKRFAPKGEVPNP